MDRCHLTMKITDVALEGYFLFHFYREEMVVALLKLLPRGILRGAIGSDTDRVLLLPYQYLHPTFGYGYEYGY